MAAIRFSKRGRKISVPDKARKERPTRVEAAVIRHLDSKLSGPESTPDRMVWPHWVGSRAKMAYTAHGELARLSPYVKQLKKKEDKE